MNYEKLPKTISAEELLSTPLPPVKWIIPDLLPAGLALFAGPSKAGKSWLTLWLCLQVAPGHQNAGGLAHTLALHDPAGIGRTHQTI